MNIFHNSAPILLLTACIGLTSCSGGVQPEAPATPAAKATSTAKATKAPAAPAKPSGKPAPLAPTSVPAPGSIPQTPEPLQPLAPTSESAPVEVEPGAAPQAPAQPLTLAEAMAVPDVQVPIPNHPLILSCDSGMMSQRLLALIKTLPSSEEADQMLQTGNGYPQDDEPGQPAHPPGSGQLDAFLLDRFGTAEFNAAQFAQDIALHAQIEVCPTSYVNDDGSFGLMIWPNVNDKTYSCGAIAFAEGVVRDGKIQLRVDDKYSKDLQLTSRTSCYSNSSTFLSQTDNWELPYVLSDES